MKHSQRETHRSSEIENLLPGRVAATETIHIHQRSILHLPCFLDVTFNPNPTSFRVSDNCLGLQTLRLGTGGGRRKLASRNTSSVKFVQLDVSPTRCLRRLRQ